MPLAMNMSSIPIDFMFQIAADAIYLEVLEADAGDGIVDGGLGREVRRRGGNLQQRHPNAQRNEYFSDSSLVLHLSRCDPPKKGMVNSSRGLVLRHSVKKHNKYIIDKQVLRGPVPYSIL